MAVHGIDHVNIIARDVPSTAAFYAGLLGLRAIRSPGDIAGVDGRWLVDADERAIFHVVSFKPERHGGREEAGTTGLIDHVALACDDFDATLHRCRAMGLESRVNERQASSLRQIFVTDPNGVLLELNFRGPWEGRAEG